MSDHPMNRIAFVVSLISLPLFAPAQDEPVIEVPIVESPIIPHGLFIPTTSTTIIDVGFSGGWYPEVQTAPHQAKIVSPDSKLILRLNDGFGPVTNVRWHHNNTPITTATDELVIERVDADDVGFYWASFDSFQGHQQINRSSAQQIIVAPDDVARATNMSVRVCVIPDVPPPTIGFVVKNSGLVSGPNSRYLVRLIGPSLADYGVSNPLNDPVVKFHDSNGNEFSLPEFVGVIPGYLEMVAAVSSQVGAFPLGQLANQEYVRIAEFPQGSFTAQISSASGETGDVIFELYELPPAE